MPFKPGKSGNPAGRPFGSENKLTTRAKGLINRMFDRLDGMEIEEIMDKGNRDFLDRAIKILPVQVDLEGSIAVNPLVDAINSLATQNKKTKAK